MVAQVETSGGKREVSKHKITDTTVPGIIILVVDFLVNDSQLSQKSTQILLIG